jgi:hypothetical protein
VETTPAKDGSDDCKYHQLDIDNQVETTPASDGSDEFDFDQSVSTGSGKKVERRKAEKSEKDTVYRARKGQERCIAITTQQKQCSYHAVNSTVFCHFHGKNKLDELSPGSKSSICELERCSSASTAAKDASTAAKDYDSAASNSGDSDSEDDNVLRPYKHKEFLKMWSDCEEYCGEMTDEIESTRRVRGANQKMSPEDTDGQLKAQYGRLLPRAMRVGDSNSCVCVARSTMYSPKWFWRYRG